MKPSMFVVATALLLGLGFVSPVNATGARECDVDTSLPCPPEANFEEPLEPVHAEDLPPGCDVEAYKDKDPEASPEPTPTPTPTPTPSPDPSASPDPSSEEAACDDDKPYYTGEATPAPAVGGGELAVPDVPVVPVGKGAPAPQEPKFDGYDERQQSGPTQVAANVDEPAEDFGSFTKPATHEPKQDPRVPENVAWGFLGSLAVIGGAIWKLAELFA